mmetsp:Transcript_9286/g.10777  ORF Transcript_9286/g.10777 Transcript_9286/m.10777 type:complete len:84 (-) Transcript_9286:76-327(-)
MHGMTKLRQERINDDMWKWIDTAERFNFNRASTARLRNCATMLYLAILWIDRTNENMRRRTLWHLIYTYTMLTGQAMNFWPST